MTDRVIVAFGPEVLVLTDAEFEVARQRGRELTQSAPIAPQASSDGLVTAQQLATDLNVAVSAVYEHAKSGRIPSVRIGKHVRFDRSAVIAALRPTVKTSASRR